MKFYPKVVCSFDGHLDVIQGVIEEGTEEWFNSYQAVLEDSLSEDYLSLKQIDDSIMIVPTKHINYIHLIKLEDGEDDGTPEE